MNISVPWPEISKQNASPCKVCNISSAADREACRIFSTYCEHHRLVLFILLPQRCFWVSASHPKCYLSVMSFVSFAHTALFAFRVDYPRMKLCIFKDTSACKCIRLNRKKKALGEKAFLKGLYCLARLSVRNAIHQLITENTT